MKAVGGGVREIRIKDEAGAFRVIYYAKLEDAILCVALFPEEDAKDRVERH